MYLYEKIAKEKEDAHKFRVMNEPPQLPKEKRFITAQTSAAHTYGNVLAFIQRYVMDLFPEDMFKTVHVNSKIAHRQIRSTNKEFLKKSKPMIIFRPRIGTYDDERFLKDTPLIERQHDLYTTWGGTNLQPFFYDHNNDINIKYQMNRSVFYVDVIVILSTLMQQIDYRHYLENAIRWDINFSLSTCLESFIPQEMLKIIGDLGHIPLYDANGSTYEFLRYMNQHSQYPITYRFRGANGNKEFFRYYPVNIDTVFTGLSTDDGEMNGNVMNSYQIEFSIRMEFNSTGFYYIFNDNLFDIKLPRIDGANTDVIPIFTDVLLKEDLQLQPGWVLYNRGALRLEGPNDVVSFRELINQSIDTTIDYHVKNSLPIFDLLDIKIRKQGKLIHNGKEYTLNVKDRLIQFHDQDTYHTYSIYICVNLEYINELIKDIYHLE